MKNVRQFSGIILSLTVAALAGGCTTATSALWDRKEHRPANNTKLELGFAPQRNDILVQYDESSKNSTNPQRRAYWLFSSSKPPFARLHPPFLGEAYAGDLTPIPIFDSDKTRKNAAPTGYSAVVTTSGFGFVLWQNDHRIQKFELPAYSDREEGTAWRVALTPFAVLGDSALTAGATAGGFVLLSIFDSDGQILYAPLLKPPVIR